MNSVIDLGWHQSEEGQGALAHLRDPITGTPKRIFGILEVSKFFYAIVLAIWIFKLKASLIRCQA